jgi:AbrB family looped-hinge helix DNA binding protein
MADMVTVTSKGQMVIPSKLRKKFGIRKGTRVSVTEEGSHLVLQPITPEYLDSLRRIVKGDGSAMKFLLEERKRDREL